MSHVAVTSARIVLVSASVQRFLLYDFKIVRAQTGFRFTSSIFEISTSHVWLNKSFATDSFALSVLPFNAPGHQPLHITYFIASIERSDSHPSKESGSSNSFFSDTCPLESPLSYKLIGYIFILDILSVPV